MTVRITTPRLVVAAGAIVAGLVAGAVTLPTSASATSSAAAAGTGVTVRAFKTPFGSAAVPVGGRKLLGTIETAGFSKIRVVAGNRAGSPTAVTFSFIAVDDGEYVAPLTTVTVRPNASSSFVVDVPGTSVALLAEGASGGTGNDAVDMVVYGATS